MKGPAEIAHGPMLIGFTFNVLLAGIMITQVYLYSVTCKKDSLWIKLFVAGILLADVLNTVFDFVYLYRSLIIFYGDVAVLGQADWIFATDPALTGIIASAVQLFFAWRVKILTKSCVLVGVVVALSLAGGVAAILTAYEVGRTPSFVQFQNFQVTVIVWLASEAIGDVLITGILVWYLYVDPEVRFSIYLMNLLRRKHKTGFSNSDMIVDRIIRITVQTGLITMIVASLDLIMFLTDETGTHLIFNFPLCKLYTNSLMSSLNSRRGWGFSTSQRTAVADSEGQVNTTSDLKSAHVSYLGRDAKSGKIIQVGVSSVPEVFVHVESHELVDVPMQPNKTTVQNEKSRFHDSQPSFEGHEEKEWDRPYSGWST